MNIKININKTVCVDEFIDLLVRSGLADRRPVDDITCIRGMLENSNLVVSAWREDELVGIARSMTDFHYACYLSDLAVDKQLHGQGIGKLLQKHTKDQLGPNCKLILISAPKANDYYPRLGYKANNRCWVLDGKSSLSC